MTSDEKTGLARLTETIDRDTKISEVRPPGTSKVPQQGSRRSWASSKLEAPPANQTQKGPKRIGHEFHPFCEFGCFSLGKQAKFASNFS